MPFGAEATEALYAGGNVARDLAGGLLRFDFTPPALAGAPEVSPALASEGVPVALHLTVTEPLCSAPVVLVGTHALDEGQVDEDSPLEWRFDYLPASEHGEGSPYLYAWRVLAGDAPGPQAVLVQASDLGLARRGDAREGRLLVAAAAPDVGRRLPLHRRWQPSRPLCHRTLAQGPPGAAAHDVDPVGARRAAPPSLVAGPRPAAAVRGHDLTGDYRSHRDIDISDLSRACIEAKTLTSRHGQARVAHPFANIFDGQECTRLLQIPARFGARVGTLVEASVVNRGS